MGVILWLLPHDMAVESLRVHSSAGLDPLHRCPLLSLVACHLPRLTLSILLWNQGTGPLCQPSQFLFLLTSYHLFSFPPTQGITSLVCVGVGMKHRFFLLLFLHNLF